MEGVEAVVDAHPSPRRQCLRQHPEPGRGGGGLWGTGRVKAPWNTVGRGC